MKKVKFSEIKEGQNFFYKTKVGKRSKFVKEQRTCLENAKELSTGKYFSFCPDTKVWVE